MLKLYPSAYPQRYAHPWLRIAGLDDYKTSLTCSGSNEWREGPELPHGVFDTQMIEDPNGGVVLVGGTSTSGQPLETLLQLSDAASQWREMEQRFKVGRKLATVFFVRS